MTGESITPELPPSTRRKFLRRAFKGCLAGGATALGYAYAIEPHWIDVVRQRLPIANLPANLVGRKLVQISDIHVGPAVDDRHLQRAFSEIADLQPDMIVMTGDYLTTNWGEEVDHALEVYQQLPPTPLGRFACLGNHDYGRLGNYLKTADRMTHGFYDLGIRVLRNEVIEVAGLQIAGLDELLLQRCLIKATLRQLEPQRAMLTLCHNPDAVDQPGWEDFEGWVLAGHTHGGQCKMPGFNPLITPVFNKRYSAGAFQLSDRRQMYINRGLGYVHRVRFNCRPEITLFTLECAAAT